MALGGDNTPRAIILTLRVLEMRFNASAHDMTSNYRTN
jgi:hypothetical protein